MLILILIDVQCSQKTVFGFSNHQNHSSGTLHPVKNPPSVKFPIPCQPLIAIWKTLLCGIDLILLTTLKEPLRL